MILVMTQMPVFIVPVARNHPATERYRQVAASRL